MALKILFVTNEVPFPPDNGVRIPSYHAMRLMQAAGHELALAVLSAETGEVESRFEKVSTLLCDGRGFSRSFLGEIRLAFRWPRYLSVNSTSWKGTTLLNSKED